MFAINTAASTLGQDLTPSFVDRGAHPRLPLSPPRDDLAAGESPAHSMIFFSYIKMHFAYVKSNILRRWLNILRNYVHSRTFFTPKIHPPPITRPATRPGPPPDPARHPTGRLPAEPARISP